MKVKQISVLLEILLLTSKSVLRELILVVTDVSYRETKLYFCDFNMLLKNITIWNRNYYFINNNKLVLANSAAVSWNCTAATNILFFVLNLFCRR